MPTAVDAKWCGKRQTFYVDVTLLGKRFRKTLPVKDESKKPLASKFAKRIEPAILSAAFAEEKRSTSLTLGEAAANYIADGRESRFVESVVDALGADTPIDEITPSEIHRTARLVYAHAQPQTQRRQFVTPAKAIINHATGETFHCKDEVRTRILSLDEANRLLDAADDEAVVGGWDRHRRTRKKIAFLLGSGCRPGELLAVGARDLRPSTGEVFIRGEEPGAGKTAAAVRWVTLPPIVWEMMGPLPDQGRVFLSPVGKPYVIRKNGGGQFLAAFHTIRKAAGLGPEVTPYVLRHTAASWHYALHKDLNLLLAFGGWKDVRTAMRYVKLTPSSLADELRWAGWVWDKKWAS